MAISQNFDLNPTCDTSACDSLVPKIGPCNYRVFHIFTARLAKRAKVMFSLCVSVHRGGPIPQCIAMHCPPPHPGPGPPPQKIGQTLWKLLEVGARAVRLLRSHRRTVLLFLISVNSLNSARFL